MFGAHYREGKYFGERSTNWEFHSIGVLTVRTDFDLITDFHVGNVNLLHCRGFLEAKSHFASPEGGGELLRGRYRSMVNASCYICKE